MLNSWRILITNISLSAYSGTETATRDLALGLKVAGHKPMVYSPLLGGVAEEIAAAGIPVVDQLHALQDTPDIIHGNHHAETIQALIHFPETRGVFVCHDRVAWHSAPPRIGRIRRYAAVDYNCRSRLTDDYRILPGFIRVIYNSVDTTRFQSRTMPLSKYPRRALVFSNYAGTNTHLESIQEACVRLNIPLDIVGSGSGKLCRQPEKILGRYDLIFAKARCALEAMSVGSSVILIDRRGLGALVTTKNVEEFRRWNFGMRLLTKPLDSDLIIQEVQRYQATDAANVSCYIRQNANLCHCVNQYLSLYREVIEEQVVNVPPLVSDVGDYLSHILQYIKTLENEAAQLKQTITFDPDWLTHERNCLRAEADHLRELTYQLTIDLDRCLRDKGSKSLS
jgi:hypothetical protein